MNIVSVSAMEYAEEVFEVITPDIEYDLDDTLEGNSGAYFPLQNKIVLDYYLCEGNINSVYFHEMVHYWQHRTGMLGLIRPMVWLWKGKEFVVDDEISYKSAPWEIMAYSLESSLTENYIKGEPCHSMKETLKKL